MNCKNKLFMTKRKAFTLIELLIVIAIIGILFIVLVSKVDFATDKAKATGVQTDFRSFQMALETVSKEKAGFNSFGWNTGDANANGIHDSIDEGDDNKDGIYQNGETWTGHKKYLETWTNKYSLIKPGTTFEADGYDKDAIFALETAINKNLDPKLHITIDAKTGLITMANGAQDPWNTQYHGAYISAEDGMDRGAIVMYSNGANQKFGSEHDIANGVPTVIVPGNNKDGADDYSLIVCYTYTNGYGEVGALTTGFSNNQNFFTGNGGNVNNGGTVVNPDNVPDDDIDLSTVAPGLYASGSNYKNMVMTWDELLNEEYWIIDNGMLWNGQAFYNDPCKATSLSGDLVLPNDGSITSLTNNKYKSAFGYCQNLTSVVLPEGITTIAAYTFYSCQKLNNVVLPDSLVSIESDAFCFCIDLMTITIPKNVNSVATGSFFACHVLKEIRNLSQTDLSAMTKWYHIYSDVSESKLIEKDNFYYFDDGESLKLINYLGFDSQVVLPDDMNGQQYELNQYALWWLPNMTSVVIPKHITHIGQQTFDKCDNLTKVYYKGTESEWNSIVIDSGNNTLLNAEIIFNYQ